MKRRDLLQRSAVVFGALVTGVLGLDAVGQTRRCYYNVCCGGCPTPSPDCCSSCPVSLSWVCDSHSSCPGEPVRQYVCEECYSGTTPNDCWDCTGSCCSRYSQAYPSYPFPPDC